MRKSESVQNLFNALYEFHAEAVEIPRTKQGFGYKYAPLDLILEYIRAPLQRNGLGVIQSLTKANVGYVGITTLVFHAPSGEWVEDTFEIPIPGKEGYVTRTVWLGESRLPSDQEFMDSDRNSSAQNFGSGNTFGRRYHLLAMLNLAPDDDDDAAKPQKKNVWSSGFLDGVRRTIKPLSGMSNDDLIAIAGKLGIKTVSPGDTDAMIEAKGKYEKYAATLTEPESDQAQEPEPESD